MNRSKKWLSTKSGIYFLIIVLLAGCSSYSKKIDRHALVTRHNPTFTAIDSLDVLTVGNGNFAFTVDATGLQTFPDYYEKGIPLGTQSNWAWHSFPNPEGYNLEQVSENFASCDDSIPYVYLYSNGEKKAASDYLRQNPHRLHLGLIGYKIVKENGQVFNVSDVKNIQFRLDMWSGKIISQFEIDDIMVKTEVFAHQNQDQIAIKITSPLIEAGRLMVSLDFPYGSGLHRSGGYDLEQPEKHSTELVKTENEALFKRTMDSTQFFIKASWEQKATIEKNSQHHYFLVPDKENESFDFSVSFSPKDDVENQKFESTLKNNESSWQAFWESGGAIDFTGSSDPRAEELERRVVLSQYLTKIQSSGILPPQETGLTFNSWYGKFHLEMHWWHAVHFALWNRTDLFSASMDWYTSILPQAKATAEWQGYEGARWPKMIGPDGKESPSNVGPFLIWQQPHPIYYAELFYRDNPSNATLEQYKELVFETADFMASFASYNENTDQYELCHPLIPAQEVFNLHTTVNPSFELAYWNYALSVAQKWRERLGMEPDKDWQEVLGKLAPLPVQDGLYLPHQNCTDAYTNPRFLNDHPIVTGIVGVLPQTEKVDMDNMTRTFDEVWEKWNWGHTWGWDYPMVAMSAARLGKADQAVDALFMDAMANTYLGNGHNYQDERLSIYLPGNGGLLTAVAMMAAGWDNAPKRPFPGFPDNGKWKIRVENIAKMP